MRRVTASTLGRSPRTCPSSATRIAARCSKVVPQHPPMMLAPASTQPLLDAGYGHSNAASMGNIDAEELMNVGLGEIAAPVLAQLPVDPMVRERMSEAFERIKAGF